MKTRKLLLAAIVLALLVAVGLWLRNEVRIDSCLDRGGNWDKENLLCEGATQMTLSNRCFDQSSRQSALCRKTERPGFQA
jgi:hypothetical protein